MALFHSNACPCRRGSAVRNAVPTLADPLINFFTHKPPPLPPRTIIFALCYFHAAMLERKKFGVGNLPGATSGIGWNMNYPFNTGDLLCCGQTAVNYLENNVKVRAEQGDDRGQAA